MQLEANLKLDQYLDIDIMSSKYSDFYASIFKCTTIFEVNTSAEGLSFEIFEVKDMALYSEVETESGEETTLDMSLSDFTKDVKITKGDSELNLLQLSFVDINLDNKTIKLEFSL